MKFILMLALVCAGLGTVLILIPNDGVQIQARQRPQASAPVSVVVWNHTDQGVSARLDDGIGGGAPAYSGGGAYMCCELIPEVWHPDLKVKVHLIVGLDDIPSARSVHEVDIPEYGKDNGDFQIHVLPGNVVKVIVSPYTLNHPSHPLYQEGLERARLRTIFEQEEAGKENEIAIQAKKGKSW